jgi:hypothetical protein
MRSTTRLAIAFVAAAVVAGLPASAPAQSLGELAKAEAARRANVKKAAQAITDKDIKPAAPAAPAAPTSASTTDSAAAASADPAAGAPPAGEGGEAVPEPMKAREKRDEPYWRKRFTETREAVARAQQDAANMQARIAAIDVEMQDSKLSAVRKSELNVERDGALLALKRFKQDATDLGGELANLEKRAQEAKIDPAWTK